MSPQEHLKLTREELHKLVWTKPMMEVAKDFQISDRAMAKICARKQVPVPPRGYWARKMAGQDVPIPPLPEFVAKPPKEKKAEATPAPKPTKKSKPGSFFEERDRKIKNSVKELRKILSEAIDYKVRIESWNCDYSFGLNLFYDPLRRDDRSSSLHESPLSEDRDLILKGVVLEPQKVKGRDFEARFVRRAHLDQKAVEENLRHYEEEPPQHIGGFHTQGKRLMAYIPIPDDAFALVLHNASANKFNFMRLEAEVLHYGRGHIYRYTLREKEGD
jgi:hypothetical protein